MGNNTNHRAISRTLPTVLAQTFRNGEKSGNYRGTIFTGKKSKVEVEMDELKSVRQPSTTRPIG